MRFKLLKNDVASCDNIEEIEAVNIYLPFINVNNYLIDNFERLITIIIPPFY